MKTSRKLSFARWLINVSQLLFQFGNCVGERLRYFVNNIAKGTTDPGVDCLSQSAKYFACLHNLHILDILHILHL